MFQIHKAVAAALLLLVTACSSVPEWMLADDPVYDAAQSILAAESRGAGVPPSVLEMAATITQAAAAGVAMDPQLQAYAQEVVAAGAGGVEIPADVVEAARLYVTTRDGDQAARLAAMVRLAATLHEGA